MFKSSRYPTVMGSGNRLLISAAVVFVLIGCTAENINNPDIQESEELSPVPTNSENSSTQMTAPVYTFADMNKVGQSNLVRTDSGISFRLKTSELEPGTVVTLWMVIFNNPGNCVEGCGADDITNPDAKADLQYASGRVIGNSGKTTYAGHLNEGDSSESIVPIWLGLPAHGLIGAREAEIHFVVHSHGPKIPELVNEMVHSFNAGCGPIFDPAFPPVPEELGTYGPNTCRDIQFAVHTP